MKRNKLRPIGDITQDMEPLLQEMMYGHKMQWHEILGLIYAYLGTHYPEGQETFTSDKSHPIYYYGHRSGVK